MKKRELLEDPIWQGDELGLPIPPMAHAVSVALPRWQDVVGYEEQKPEVVMHLQTGYPRFVIHSSVRKLARQLSDAEACLPFPSVKTAVECANFIKRSSGAAAEIITKKTVSAVATSAKGAASLKAFWQHAGVIVSSRQAEAILEDKKASPDASVIRKQLRLRLAHLYDCHPGDVFLTPSGMAAHYLALKVLNILNPGSLRRSWDFPMSIPISCNRSWDREASCCTI